MTKDVNKIIFGSMRMNDTENTIHSWVNLFKLMWDKGVKLHHVSSEYESYQFYLEVLNNFRETYPNCTINYIVKLAEPHFNLYEFNKESLINGIEQYRRDLQVNVIHSVQWMWRGDLKNDSDRIKGFERDVLLIKESVDYLKKSGKINFFHVFPYTIDFAETAIKFDFIDGLIVYRNKLETEFDGLLLKQNELNKFGYILRPLAAGKLDFTSNSPKKYFEYALEMPSVNGGIVSISSINRLNEILS